MKLIKFQTGDIIYHISDNTVLFLVIKIHEQILHHSYPLEGFPLTSLKGVKVRLDRLRDKTSFNERYLVINIHNHTWVKL